MGAIASKYNFVYCLSDPTDCNRVRYIGRTSNPISRHKQHSYKAAYRSDELEGWLNHLTSVGSGPTMSILWVCSSKEDAILCENYVQNLAKTRGVLCFNFLKRALPVFGTPTYAAALELAFSTVIDYAGLLNPGIIYPTVESERQAKRVSNTKIQIIVTKEDGDLMKRFQDMAKAQGRSEANLARKYITEGVAKDAENEANYEN